VPESREGREVAPRPAAEIEDPEGRLARDVSQQGGDVLADVVVARAGSEVLGALVVVRQRAGGDLTQAEPASWINRPEVLDCGRTRS
jgi:hypothetical protein